METTDTEERLYYVILHKGLERPRILLSWERNSSPLHEKQGLTILTHMCFGGRQSWAQIPALVFTEQAI